MHPPPATDSLTSSKPAATGQEKPEPGACVGASLRHHGLPTFAACPAFLAEGCGGIAGIPGS